MSMAPGISQAPKGMAQGMGPAIKRDSHQTSTKVSTQLKDIQKTLPLRVLSKADFEHWQTRGYVIVRNAVDADHVERLKALLWEFEEKNPKDPSTWYTPQRRDHIMKELNGTGMVEIYNHQYLWDSRMTQRVYDAFVDIWDMEDLWVSIDRANLNPPKKVKGPNQNGFIHWDSDTSLDPLPIGVQGVLSLVKQDGDIGGFQCIPELCLQFRRMGQNPAGRPRPDASRYDRPADGQHRDGSRRPDDLQQPPRPRRPAQSFRRPGAHGAIHLDVSGRQRQHRRTQ